MSVKSLVKLRALLSELETWGTVSPPALLQANTARVLSRVLKEFDERLSALEDAKRLQPSSGGMGIPG